MLSNSYQLFYFFFLLYDSQSYILIGLIIVPEKPHYERLSFFLLARLIFLFIYSNIISTFFILVVVDPSFYFKRFQNSLNAGQLGAGE